MFGGKAAVAGGILGSSAIGAGSQQETNELMQQMSNTQYQRAMADMEAAGLNPILAGDKGGAGTPQLQAPAKGAGLGQAAKTLAMDLPQSEAEVASKQANTEVAKEVKKRTQAETELTKANQDVARSNAQRNRAGAARDITEARATKGSVGYVAGRGVEEADDQYDTAKARISVHKQELQGRRDKALGTSHQYQTADQAYAGGRANVYGGTHSAKAAQTSGMKSHQTPRYVEDRSKR